MNITAITEKGGGSSQSKQRSRILPNPRSLSEPSLFPPLQRPPQPTSHSMPREGTLTHTEWPRIQQRLKDFNLSFTNRMTLHNNLGLKSDFVARKNGTIAYPNMPTSETLFAKSKRKKAVKVGTTTKKLGKVPTVNITESADLPIKESIQFARQRTTLPVQSTGEHVSHSLPYLPQRPEGRAGDATITVKKKLEQFRRWHEDQYKKKIEVLTLNNDTFEQPKYGQKSLYRTQTNIRIRRSLQDTRFGKFGELTQENLDAHTVRVQKEVEKGKQDTSSAEDTRPEGREAGSGEAPRGEPVVLPPVSQVFPDSPPPALERMGTKLVERDGDDEIPAVAMCNDVEPIAEEPEEKAVEERPVAGETALAAPAVPGSRTGSARTWRTWRDVNDSYAYTDVRQYIEENELMPEEKEVWISRWLDEVEPRSPTPDRGQAEVT